MWEINKPSRKNTMDILTKASAEQAWFTRMERERFGYTTKTTFWSDFTIADAFGIKAINDTYRRSKANFKNNVEYIAELVLVLNHKSWYYAEHNEKLSRVYADLYYKANDYAWGHFKGEDATYLFNVLD